MHRVALLFSNRSFGNLLARAIELAVDEYEVDVLSGLSVYERTCLVRRGNYDLIVADEPTDNGPLAAALARLHGAVFALVLRDFPALTSDRDERISGVLAVRTRLCLRAADSLFVLDESTRTHFSGSRLAEKVLTLDQPIGVDNTTRRASSDDIDRKPSARQNETRVREHNRWVARQYAVAWNTLLDGETLLQRDIPILERDPDSSFRSVTTTTPIRQRTADSSSNDRSFEGL